MKKKQENIDEVLLLKIIENRADDSEVRLFRVWHDNSAENAEMYAQLKKTYQLSSFDTHSTQANWKQVADKVRTGYNVPDFIELPEFREPGRKISLNALLRVAAVIVFLLGITFLLKNIVFSPEQLIVSGSDLKNNEPYHLPDGSSVYLHGNSVISFPKKFGTKNREVALEGEAFFEIIRNEKLPFVITSNKTITRVLGTSFDVFSESSGKVKVSVVTGVVEFFTGKRNIVKLRAGEQGTYSPATNRIEKAVISDPNFQSWKTGILVFRDTPLNEAFDLLSDYYSKVFVFEGEESEVPAITTTFSNQPFAAVQEELNLLLNTKTFTRNDTIFFKTNN
jgi:transmembrane sensor